MRRFRTENSQSPLSDTGKHNTNNSALHPKTINNNNSARSASSSAAAAAAASMSAGSKAMQMRRPPNSAAAAASENAISAVAGVVLPQHQSSNQMLPHSIAGEIQRIGAVIARCDDKLANAGTWERRHEALLRARDLFSDPQNQSLMARSADFLSVVGGAMRDGLCAQLVDIRSQISKEACAVVDAMTSCAAGALGVCEAVADWFLPTLLSICSNSAAVVATAAADTVRRILIRGRVNRDCLASIYRACGDKHNAVRSEALLALLMAMHFAVDRPLLLKQLNSISSTLRSGLGDKLPAARLRARVGCWALDALSHEAAVALLAGCEIAVKKQVLDEEPTYAAWIARGTDVMHFTVEDAAAASRSPQFQQQQQQQQQVQQRGAPAAAVAAGGNSARVASAPPSSAAGRSAATIKRPAASAAPASAANSNSSNNNNNATVKNVSFAGDVQQQQQQQQDQQPQQRPRSNTVSLMQDIFATPAMTLAFSPSRQRAALVQQNQMLSGNEADTALSQSSSAATLQGGLLVRRQQQQDATQQRSKWQELNHDYADSDWKHRIQVLGLIESTVLGNDKDGGGGVGGVSVLRDSASSPDAAEGKGKDAKQVRVELPGSGSYAVEPGGSLLALAEVLYDNSRGGGSSSSTSAAGGGGGGAATIGSLPGFFRRDPSGATPSDVLHLVLTGVEDVNPKVSVAGMQALQKLLERSPVVVAAAAGQQMERLFRSMFVKLGDMKEQVREKAVEVLSLLRRRVGADRLVPVLLGRILDLVQHRVRLACIEYLHAGVPFFDAFFQSSNNMRTSITKITAFAQRVHTQEIGRAAIACLARLVERHRELFVASVLALDLKEQGRVVEALHVAVPYLQQDLRRKLSREPLLLQSPPDTALAYSLFISPDAKRTQAQQQHGGGFGGAAAASAGTQSQNKDGAPAGASSSSGRAGSKAREQSSSRSASPASAFRSKFPLPPGLGDSAPSSPMRVIVDGDQQQKSFSPRVNSHSSSEAASKYDSRNYMPSAVSKNGSPVKQRQQQQQQANNGKGGQAARAKFADPNSSSQQQQQQQQPESWFVRHQNNLPKSQVEQWAADRRDPPPMVALAAAVTSEDKIQALNDLCRADASLWLDHFARLSPFPIALCGDSTDHAVRVAALRCTKLLMAAPALRALPHHSEGTLEAAVRAVARCLEDPFPEVRNEAAAALFDAFQSAPRFACLKAVLAVLGDLLQQQQQQRGSQQPSASATSAATSSSQPFFGSGSSQGSALSQRTSSAFGPATGSLPFLLKHLAGVFLRGYGSNRFAVVGGNGNGGGNSNNTEPLLGDVCRLLVRAFSHDSPDVRKLVVTAVVDLLLGMAVAGGSSLAAGDDAAASSAASSSSANNGTDGLRALFFAPVPPPGVQALLPHLASLTTAQMRLVDIYWNRAAKDEFMASGAGATMNGGALPMLELSVKMAQVGLSRRIA